MPYVAAHRRVLLRPKATQRPADAGELNFVLTSMVHQYIKDRGLSYANINDVLGALEGAKLEFYRRVAAGYESEACARNGDVYA